MVDRFGVRTRVIVASSAIFAVVLGIIAVVLWNATASAVYGAAEVTARSSVSRMGAQLKLTDPVNVAPPVVDRSRDVLDGTQRFQQIWSQDGSVLATSDPRHPERVQAAIAMNPRVGSIEVRRLPQLNDEEQGQVVVAVLVVEVEPGRTMTAVAVEPAHLEMPAQRRLLALAVLLTLVAMTGLALLLSAAVTAALTPVDRLRKELEQISSSQNQVEVATSGRDDEIGRLGSTINALLARLHRSETQRAALVSDAGHELRSPLSTIALSLEQLRADPPAGRRAQIVERGEGEVVRLTRLVDDLLSLAALDEGRTAPGTDDIDLDDVVLGEIGVARAKGAKVVADLAPTRITGTPEQIQRIVRNLLDNARRHAAEQIRVTVRAEDGEAVLCVDNDGDSVPPADRDRIFERFFRLDDARDRDRGGSGLGLAIVESLAKAHGGSVSVADAPDGWCRFTVRLPIQ